MSLTVTDNGGETGETTNTVVVDPRPVDGIVVEFTWTPQAPDAGETVQFTDTSTTANGTIQSWAWNFGDGTTSTAQNPTHTYSACGPYTVTLSVTSDGITYPEAGPKTHTIRVCADEIYGYPNPARSEVLIVFSLPDGATDAMLRVFNLMGILVVEVAIDSRGSSYRWTLRDDVGSVVSNGLYFVVATATNATGGTWRSAIFRLLVAR